MIEFNDNPKIWPRVDEGDIKSYLAKNPYITFLDSVDVKITFTLSNGPFVDYQKGVVVNDSGVYKLPDTMLDAAPLEASNLSWADVPIDDLTEFEVDGLELTRVNVNMVTGNLLELYTEYSDATPFGIGYVLRPDKGDSSITTPVLYSDSADGDFDPIVQGFSLFKSKSMCQAVHRWLVGAGINFFFGEAIDVLRPNFAVDIGIIAFVPKGQRLSFVLTGDMYHPGPLNPGISNLPLEDENTIGFFILRRNNEQPKLLRLYDDDHQWNSAPRGAVEVKSNSITQSFRDSTIDDGDQQVIGQSVMGRVVNGLGSVAVLVLIYFLFRNK